MLICEKYFQVFVIGRKCIFFSMTFYLLLSWHYFPYHQPILCLTCKLWSVFTPCYLTAMNELLRVKDQHSCKILVCIFMSGPVIESLNISNWKGPIRIISPIPAPLRTNWEKTIWPSTLQVDHTSSIKKKCSYSGWFPSEGNRGDPAASLGPGYGIFPRDSLGWSRPLPTADAPGWQWWEWRDEQLKGTLWRCVKWLIRQEWAVFCSVPLVAEKKRWKD